MMSYPNRSHGISEGDNTRKHLFTLITNYILKHVPVESTE
jgi:dipeptidyl-peptidase-4